MNKYMRPDVRESRWWDTFGLIWDLIVDVLVDLWKPGL